MKLLIFTAYYYPHAGGVENYVHELFKGMDVTVVTCNTEGAKPFERIHGFKVYRFDCYHLMNNTYPVLKYSSLKKIDQLVSQGGFDYIVTNTRFFHTSLIGVRAGLKYHIPVIHFEHGTQHSPIKNPLLHLLGVWYDHTIGRYIVKNATTAVGISHASEQFIKHLYNRKTFCVYNGVDTALFKKKKTALKKKLGITGPVIIFVGRLIYAKGVQDLLEAARGLDMTVIVIGDGPYRKTLEETYPWAKFVGAKNSSEIAEYLSIADIFVNPSYAEGLPTSVLEAGSSGVCCIATDVGGTKEIITHLVNGYLIKPQDAEGLRKHIVTLLNDKKLRDKFSKRLQLKIRKEFDWKVGQKKLRELLSRNRNT
ncbi:MAG: glycosyltransferase family 4 protein [Candidatus Woesearchaeota archaeon]